MDEQDKNRDQDHFSNWQEKKEAFRRLAEALEKTSPPLQNKKDENSHLSIKPVGSTIRRKIKPFFARIFNMHKGHSTTL
jgi:hypothetical protein